MRALVIAVAGIIDCRASAVSDELAHRLDRCSAIHIKDYEAPLPSSDWMANKNSFNSLDLRAMRNGVDRLAASRACDCVIVDLPVGRCAVDISSAIDCVFYLDCPFDIALARRLMREVKYISPDAVSSNLRIYLEQGWLLARKIERLVRPAADIVIPYGNVNDTVNTMDNLIRRLLVNRYLL